MKLVKNGAANLEKNRARKKSARQKKVFCKKISGALGRPRDRVTTA